MEKSQPLKTLKQEAFLQLLGIPLPALVLGVWFFTIELGAQITAPYRMPWLQGVVGSVLLVYALDFSRDAHQRKQKGVSVPDSWFWAAGAWGLVGVVLVAMSALQLGWQALMHTLVLGWPVLLVLFVYAYLRHLRHPWAAWSSPVLMLLGIAAAMLVPIWHSAASIWGFLAGFLLLVWMNIYAFAYLERDKDERMSEPNPWLNREWSSLYIFIPGALVLSIAWQSGNALALSESGMLLALGAYSLAFLFPKMYRPYRWYRFGLDLVLLLPLFV